MVHYQNDPIGFFENVLGVPREKFLWSELPAYGSHVWDSEKVDPLAAASMSLAAWKSVGLESATAVGKTFWAACTLLWFLGCWESTVITVAPKGDQLKLHMWKEITRLWPRFKKAFPEAELTTLRIRMRYGSDEWAAHGFVAGVTAEERDKSATKAQGFHAEHMLIICEETPGISPAIMEALKNTSVAAHNLILAMGNPDHELDELHKFCLRSQVDSYRISGYDHPNVVLDDHSFIAGATTRAKLQERLEDYGEDSPLYLSRCRGLCPKESEHSLIKYSWLLGSTPSEEEKVLAALAMEHPFQKHMMNGPSARGIDVANSEAGDYAAVALGIGPVCLSVNAFRCPNANQLGADQATEIKSTGTEQHRVGVDAVGVGAGCVNELKRLGIMAVPLQGGPVDRPGEQETYASLRAQMYWQLRLDLQHGRVFLPHDEELFNDLRTPRWWTKNGKIIVEPKEEIRRRLGRSPNKGDAVVYWNWVRQLPGGGGSVTVCQSSKVGSRGVNPGVQSARFEARTRKVGGWR
jgi:hypothetical protein